MTPPSATTTEPASPEVSSRAEAHRPAQRPHEVRFRVLQHVILPTIILLAGVGGLYGFAKLKPEPPRQEILPFVPSVETVDVVPFDGTLTLDVDGTVVPFRQIRLASEVAGRIKNKNPLCRAGNFVTKGTLLFEIDPVDFQLEIKRLTQEVKQVESSIRELDIELENYQRLMGLAAEDRNLQLREVRRLKSLVDNKTVTESELDQALGAEVVKRNALQLLANQIKMMVPRRAALEASLALAETGLEKAELDLERTKIYAPVESIIVVDLFEENAFVSRGTTLTELAETSSMEVRCNLRADQLFWLWGNRPVADDLAAIYEVPAAKCKVIFRLGSLEYEWDGVLSRYEGTGLDERTRTIPCRVLVENPNGGRLRNSSPGLGDTGPAPVLVRGMFVNLEIEADVDTELLKIPLEAQQLGGTVWKVEGDTLRVAPVTVAKLLPHHVLVDAAASAINPGDLLVITPIANVRDGMEIRLADDGSSNGNLQAEVSEAALDNESY